MWNTELWNRCRLTVSFLETLRGKKQKNRNFHQLKSEAKHQFRRVMPACTRFSLSPLQSKHVCSIQSVHHRFRYASVNQLTKQLSPSSHTSQSDAQNAKSKQWEAAWESSVTEVHRILCSSNEHPKQGLKCWATATAARGTPGGGRGEKEKDGTRESNKGGRDNAKGTLKKLPQPNYVKTKMAYSRTEGHY